VPVRLLDKGRRMALRLVGHGPAALSTLQWYGYNLWMLSKIRFLTSPLATLLPHRPARQGPLPDA